MHGCEVLEKPHSFLAAALLNIVIKETFFFIQAVYHTRIK